MTYIYIYIYKYMTHTYIYIHTYLYETHTHIYIYIYNPLRGSAHTIQGVDYLEQVLDFIQFMSGGPPVGLGTSGFYCLFVVDFI